MKLSIKKGFSFGLVSGIITTLGLIVGLNSGTSSNIIIIGSIFVIAVADGLSDSLGVHISEESDKNKSQRQVWESTLATFISKFFIVLTLVIPFLLFELSTAVIVCIVWGLSLIALFSFYIAKLKKAKPHKIILEHILIAILVIIATRYIGIWVSTWS